MVSGGGSATTGGRLLLAVLGSRQLLLARSPSRDDHRWRMQATRQRPDAHGRFGQDAAWIPVGASPFNSDLFGREGSKISKPQDVMEYYGASTLGQAGGRAHERRPHGRRDDL